jgi:hypothetical protein
LFYFLSCFFKALLRLIELFTPNCRFVEDFAAPPPRSGLLADTLRAFSLEFVFVPMTLLALAAVLRGLVLGMRPSDFSWRFLS